MVDMIRVSSSNIDAIGYDSENRKLYVRFLSAETYVYYGVPQEIYGGLMRAPSKGSYLSRVIKDTYQFSKV